ncbi:hypothetical protein SM124_17950, partial [Bacillus sp. 31A1R]
QKKGTNINLICRLSFLLPQQNIDVKFLLKFKLIYNFAKPVGLACPAAPAGVFAPSTPIIRVLNIKMELSRFIFK